MWDVVVIGAGAAGLMSAIHCQEAGLKTLLLDGQPKIGAKILMSGGTRCNVTNREVTQKNFATEVPRVVRNVLRNFSSIKAIQFFESIGVALVLEDSGKYFPVTHSGRTVLEGLMRKVSDSGVVLKENSKVTHLESLRAGGFQIQGKSFDEESQFVILATGGLSYPTSGSDGSGYALAQAFGHSLVTTTPALTPLLTDDSDWKQLSGVALPARLSLWVDQKKEAVFEGDFLFTHFGFSGPAILDMSRHWDRMKNQGKSRLAISFLPTWHEEKFRSELRDLSVNKPTIRLKNLLSEILPERFVEIFLYKLGIQSSTVLNQFKREERERMISALFATELPVRAVFGYNKAEVTAGGVSLKEVDPHTLESKLQSGLFFAGEILDVDGCIGGFNFQWAWSSAVAASQGIRDKIKPL